MPCFAVAFIFFVSLPKCWLFLICCLHNLISSTNHGSIRSLQFFTSSPSEGDQNSFRHYLMLIVHQCFFCHEEPFHEKFSDNPEIQSVEKDQECLRQDTKKDQESSDLYFSHCQHRNCTPIKVQVLLCNLTILQLENLLQNLILIHPLSTPLDL